MQEDKFGVGEIILTFYFLHFILLVSYKTKGSITACLTSLVLT